MPPTMACRDRTMVDVVFRRRPGGRRGIFFGFFCSVVDDARDDDGRLRRARGSFGLTHQDRVVHRGDHSVGCRHTERSTNENGDIAQ